jgi:hypothetical protein
VCGGGDAGCVVQHGWVTGLAWPQGAYQVLLLNSYIVLFLLLQGSWQSQGPSGGRVFVSQG